MRTGRGARAVSVDDRTNPHRHTTIADGTSAPQTSQRPKHAGDEGRATGAPLQGCAGTLHCSRRTLADATHPCRVPSKVRRRGRPGHAKNRAHRACRPCRFSFRLRFGNHPHSEKRQGGLPREARSGLLFRLRGRPPARHRRGRSPPRFPRATTPMVRRWSAETPQRHSGPEGRGRENQKTGQRPRQRQESVAGIRDRSQLQVSATDAPS